MTPDEIAWRLKYGQDTLAAGRQQAANPSHWTQALAGALQMGIGGHYGANAQYETAQGKAGANKQLADLLSSGADPRTAASTMLANPWTADQGQKLAMSEMDPLTGLQRQKAQLGIDRMRADAALDPLRRQKLQIDVAQAKSEMDARQNLLGMFNGDQNPQPVSQTDQPFSEGVGRFAAPQIAPPTLRQAIAALPPVAKQRAMVAVSAGKLDEALKIIQESSPSASGTFNKDKFNATDKLRSNFESVTKDFRTVRDSYTTIQGAGNNPSPAGDLSLIYAYMKMLDPGSVVRESEFAMAAKAGSLPTQIQNLANKAISGTLSGKTRQDFLNRARLLYKSRERDFSKSERLYGAIAKRSGLNVDDVIVDPRATDTPQPMNIPPDAASELMSDPSPEAIAEFDSIFGAGAAKQVLGNGR